MKTLTEQIAVMKAALEGKPILIKPYASSLQLKVTEAPLFDWSSKDYDVFTENHQLIGRMSVRNTNGCLLPHMARGCWQKKSLIFGGVRTSMHRIFG
jgi:hypothetical protein